MVSVVRHRAPIGEDEFAAASLGQCVSASATICSSGPWERAPNSFQPPMRHLLVLTRASRRLGPAMRSDQLSTWTG